ncbi:exosome complex protein Rrp42 [Candidatus Woesearchaeota archaeon]|nr:exosome complex protein Rrp42 [Candidatus Woesearchaeota archaeon]MCF7901329.1 exosome complex protein Rrp42 [Candidatus Woesearchaeota archaeon]MCF8014003.1 exosome complex protein Rrp42 [Candidatus Woesearchaeota archaeon]
MNQEMKEHVKQALKQGKRLDGRALDEIRPIKIQTGIISTAEGSAKVKFGDAEVLAGVKMALEKPYPDTPEDGVLMVNAELLPLSSPEFEAGPPSIESIETARVIDRGIRESKTIDTKGLCLEKGEKVWSVAVDIVPLNFDGNLIDMGGLAAIAAIKTARYPTLNEDGSVDYHKRSENKLELANVPIPITVCKLGDLFIVDPTEQEEKAVDTRLTITTLDENTICALQKGGDVPLKVEDVQKMVELAFKSAGEIRKILAEVN